MGKRRVLSGQDVINILAVHGFTLVRQRGSHLVMQMAMPDTTITVPVPNHRELRAGTLASIIRQSGLPRELFEHP